MASTGYGLYRVGENTRIAHRFLSPDPQTFKKQAWAELRDRQLRPGMPVFIRIFKQSSELELWLQGQNGWELYRTIDICNWSGKLGPKLKEGDRQSPEGFYTVTKARLNPNSRHHLSFNLGFPNGDFILAKRMPDGTMSTKPFIGSLLSLMTRSATAWACRKTLVASRSLPCVRCTSGPPSTISPVPSTSAARIRVAPIWTASTLAHWLSG